MRRQRHAAKDREPSKLEIRWAPERFYWSVLDAPGWSRAGVLPEGLRSLLGDDVPCEKDPEGSEEGGDPLHAVCVPVGDGRIVVCAALRSTLAAMTGAEYSVSPASLPDCISVPGSIELSRLNLLVGELEPANVRHHRRQRNVLGAAALLLCSAFVAAGLARRSAHWREVADAAAAAREQLVAGLAMPASGPDRIAAEIAGLKRTTDALGQMKMPADATAALADLLRAWPTSVPCKPQSLTIAGGSASVSVLIDGDPTPFLQSLSLPPAWTLDEPRLNTAGSLTRLALSLRWGSDGGRPERGLP